MCYDVCLMPDRDGGEPTDEELIERFYACEDEAVDVLYRRHRAALTAYLASKYGFEVGQDAVAAAFLKILGTKVGGSRYDRAKGASFKTWMYTIGRNKAIDELRERGREPPTGFESLEQLLGEAAAGNPETVDVQRCIDELPERLREVVLLRYWADLTVRDVAEILDIGIATVSRRERDARQQLQGCLGNNYSE